LPATPFLHQNHGLIDGDRLFIFGSCIKNE
jgi:hypothetical protein